MSNITGLFGYNKSGASINKLLASFGNDVNDVSTGLGYSLNLNSSFSVEFAAFIDAVFLQNYSDRPRSFNGTTWTYKHVGRTPLSKYLRPFKNRMYLANCKFPDPQSIVDSTATAITFPSRVFYSDFFLGDELTWGLDWGTGGQTLDNIFLANGANQTVHDFVTRNIKVGDPFFITQQTNNPIVIGRYTVSSVDSAYRLRMTKNFAANDNSSSINWWVGSNWFDVETDNNDQITGMGENSDSLLVFKLMSLHYYTGTQLRKIYDAVGTSSNRSIINHRGDTYYFHGSDPKISGIYKLSGVTSNKISRFIDPFIQGMSTASYDDVVVWKEGEELRFFLGDISNANYNISMTNAVATINTITGAWDVSPIADVITAATTFRTSNREDTYTGTSDNQVLQMADGDSFNTTPIGAILETKVYYPSGSTVINTFPAIQVIGRATRGIKVKYKLWDDPTGIDDQWYGLGELTDDKTELRIPTKHQQASGIQLRFDEIGILENDPFVEKITIFYKPERTRML